jgi:hypothetical protein
MANLGQIAYEAYSDKTEGRSLVNSDILPVWKDLPWEVRDAWIAAAQAVERAVTN